MKSAIVRNGKFPLSEPTAGDGLHANKGGAVEPSLPPERAFVVQFCGGTTVQAADSGRVEHVVSGRASHFESIEQLLSFVERMLRSVAPTNDPQR